MRYAQGGGLTAERQEFRERLRRQAAERFAQGETNAAIAKELRITVRSVQRWRRAWQEGGCRALESKGPASVSRLSEEQFRLLEAELTKGPVAHGWDDGRWTLERIRIVIGRQFHVSYTIQGVRKLLLRHGWSRVTPAGSRRAAARGGETAGGWAKSARAQPETPRRRAAPAPPQDASPEH